MNGETKKRKLKIVSFGKQTRPGAQLHDPNCSLQPTGLLHTKKAMQTVFDARVRSCESRAAEAVCVCLSVCVFKDKSGKDPHRSHEG